MKKFSFVLVALVLAIMLTGCSDSEVSPQVQSQVSEAFQGNIFVNQSGDVSDIKVLDNFLTSVSKGEAANLQIKRITEEGDPIFHTLEYNKDVIKHTVDDSQDKLRGAKKGPDTKIGEYVRIVKEENDRSIIFNLIDKNGNPTRILAFSK